MSTEEKIKEIISEVFNITTREINHSTSANAVENWDSLKHLDMIVFLEDEFNIEFSDEEIINMTDYNIIKKIVAAKLSIMSGSLD